MSVREIETAACPPKRRSLRPSILTLALAVALAGGVLWVLARLGSWLIVEDGLEPAHAVVVLSGHMPLGAREAAKLYGQGFAARVWVTHPASPAEELDHMHIDYVGEEFYNQRVLMYLGVPADAIRVLEKPILNTDDEVRVVADELRREEGGKVILVTSKAHTRRVKAIWEVRIGRNPRALVRSASEDRYDGAHWWRNTNDALEATREVMGLANVWAGFPLRPQAR